MTRGFPVRLDRPASVFSHGLGFLFVIDRADELRRQREGRVVLVHHHPGDHRDRVLVVDEVVQLHLKHISDLARALGIKDVERIWLDVPVGIAHER